MLLKTWENSLQCYLFYSCGRGEIRVDAVHKGFCTKADAECKHGIWKQLFDSSFCNNNRYSTQIFLFHYSPFSMCRGDNVSPKCPVLWGTLGQSLFSLQKQWGYQRYSLTFIFISELNSSRFIPLTRLKLPVWLIIYKIWNLQIFTSPWQCSTRWKRVQFFFCSSTHNWREINLRLSRK